MQRIKQLSQRESNGQFSPFYPIGADGLNIDMLSGSNLEEELHLGSPGITTFDTDETGKVTITEEYRKDESQTDKYHVMMTTFEVVNNEMTIVQKLYYMKDSQLELKKTKTVTFISSDNHLKIKEEVK